MKYNQHEKFLHQTVFYISFAEYNPVRNSHCYRDSFN